MELVGPAIDIAKCCVPYIRQKLGFVFYNKNVQDLTSQIDKLAEKKAEIEERLDLVERRNLHKPKPHVADWLNKVHTLETETSIDWEEGNQKCFMGLCLNWRNRYILNKQVQRKTSEVKNLIEEVQRFEALDISAPPLAPTVEKTNISGYMETESSNIMIQKITDLLESESVKAVGVWGMGGVGKTTLVKRLNNDLKSNSIFDMVIMVTISQSPNWKQIHKQIAERIGLNLIDYESEDRRVNMLSMALKKEKSVLFIVDDVWTYFDLSLLGIPDDTSCIKYKVIITTRIQSVCDQMGVGKEEQFELKPMSKDDSWNIFQAKAGYVANLPALQPIAIELCDKCGGSPLAICTFASTLRGDTKKVSWNSALRALSSSDQTQISDIFMPVFTSIEFSFNRLTSEDVKLSFLYCCSHPNDNNGILLSDMRIYGISQKLINGRILRDASERVEAIVEELRKSSLVVVHDEYENFVSIHDVVRQVGILIASKKYGFLIKSGQQLDVHDMSFNNQPNHISVSHSKINKLPKMLCCPSLLALDMHDMSFNNKPEIHEEFFAKTTKLQFLDISRTGISCLPNSVYDLIHLCALDVRGLRNLLDISSIGKLNCLEILILDDTGIEELPKELGNLDNLKMLHLKNTRKLKRVAPNIFKKLSGLQELNMENSFDQWELNGESGVNASLSEIFGLSQLVALHLDIIDPLCLQQNYMGPSLSKLETFSIVVATSRVSINIEKRFVRYLSLANIPLGLGNWICKLFEICEYVNLNGSVVVEALPYRQIMGFNGLTEIRISNFGRMKHIIDSQGIARIYENDPFPSLEQLVLEDMDNLESVCNSGSVRGIFFSKLTHIQIHNCENLQILFKGSIYQALQNLTDIQIHGCDQLKALTDVIGPGYFQKLKEIEVKDCGNLEIMLAGKAVWECLETICVTGCNNLREIFQKSPFPQNLKYLKIENCKNLTTSVSSLIQRSFSSIETIEVVDCNPGNVEYLLSTNEIDEPWNKNVFENLKVVKVVGFDGKGIFNGPISQCSLQNLVDVSIVCCHDLTSIWGSSENFALLKPPKTLMIGMCDKLMLKEVFLPDEMGDEFALRVENLVFFGLSQLTTLALLPQASLHYVKSLQVSFCENLKYLLPHQDASILNHLNTLLIQDCCNLENTIIRNGESSCDLKNITQLWIDNCSQFDLKKLGLTSNKIMGLTLRKLTQLQSLDIIGQRCDTIKVLECENLEKLSSYEDACILNDSENLVIYDCPKLLPFIPEKEIAPQTSFKILKFLFIGDCHSLKNIFSVSIALTLVSLQDIIVANCNELREIVALSDSVQNEVVYADLFPRLTTVSLFWLPKLECFCRGNPTLIWPSLNILNVWESPNLTTLGMGPSSAPKLVRIRGKEEWFHHFEKESPFYSRLRSLFRILSYSNAFALCSIYESWIASTAYTSKLKKTVESQEGNLR